MSVELYAGGFARFFLGDWKRASTEESSSRVAEADGEEPEDDAAAEAATPAEVQAFFERFRDAVAAELRPHLQTPLSWTESLAGAHEAVAVTEAEFGALMVIVARAAVQNKRLNPVVVARDWFEDPAVQAVQDAEEAFLPLHHLVKADSWLPGDFQPILETEVPERDVILGSVPQLAQALADAGRLLNTPNETTRKLAPDFVEAARRAHAGFLKIVAYATANGLPILIE